MAGDDEDFKFDLTPAGKMVFQQVSGEIKTLRTSIERFESKLTSVVEALIRIETQNVAARLTELQKDEINPLKNRIDTLERWQLRLTTGLVVAGVLWALVTKGLDIWLALRPKP